MLMSKAASRKHYIIGSILVILAAVGLFGVLPRFGDFKSSLTTLKEADPFLVVCAATASLLSVACSAVVYKLLSVRKLRFADTLLVQLSGLLVNRVLPAGVGGLGLNYLYLRAHKHTVAQASSVVALNNSIGLTGHVVLALILLGLAPAAFAGTSLPAAWLPVVLAFIGILVLVIIGLYRWHPGLFKAFRGVVHFYVKRPQRLSAAIGMSLLLTLSNVLALWLCCQALGVSLDFLEVFIVFTFGIVVGTATPTPGGLGGVEAGLVGALVAQDVTTATALAIALLYRLTSYWFGLVVGAFALIGVARRRLLQ